MAAITPVTKGTFGWVQPGYIYLNDAAAAPNPTTRPKLRPTAGLIHERWYFPDADSGELWTKCPAGTVAIAYSQNGSDVTAGNATMNAGRQVLMGGTTDARVYLHTWRAGSRNTTTTGTNVPPVTKGTAGYIHPANSFWCWDHTNGVPDPVTPITGASGSVQVGPKSGAQSLRHIVLYFVGFDGGVPDTWIPPDRIAPKIVDWAFQSFNATDTCVPAYDGVSFFLYGATADTGWLHLWTR